MRTKPIIKGPILGPKRKEDNSVTSKEVTIKNKRKSEVDKRVEKDEKKSTEASFWKIFEK